MKCVGELCRSFDDSTEDVVCLSVEGTWPDVPVCHVAPA